MPTKIAFVSCAYAAKRPTQPAWGEILDAKPDLLLMLGDNAYMSWYGPDWDFQALEDCYRKQFDIPDFRRLIDTVPTLAIWDDHDCGPDDTLGAEVPADYLATTREKFDRWMGFARNNNRPHMYCTYNDLADVQVIMLDVRTHRTSSVGAQPTLLGQTQEQWLWQRLDPIVTPQRKFTIVASGTGLSVGKPGHRVDNYEPLASGLRSRLAYRRETPWDVGRRALFLGGDVHYNRFQSDPSGFHEAISSGVACFRARTNDFTPASHADNWGLITIGQEVVELDFHCNALTTGNQKPVRIKIADWTAEVQP